MRWTDGERLILKELYLEGRPLKTIGERLGKTRNQVSCQAYWFGLRRRHTLYTSFTPELSPTLAYVVGVLKGDGSVTKQKKGTYYIHLCTSEEKFAKSFSNSLKELGFRAKTKKWGTYYYAYTCSLPFGKWYWSLNESELEQLVSNEEQAREFIRGFYESEGLVWSLPKSRLFIAMWNKRLDLLEFIGKVMLRKGFRFSFTEDKRTGVKRLSVLGGSAESRRFLEWIKPCIKNIERVK